MRQSGPGSDGKEEMTPHSQEIHLQDIHNYFHFSFYNIPDGI